MRGIELELDEIEKLNWYSLQGTFASIAYLIFLFVKWSRKFAKQHYTCVKPKQLT